MDRSGVDLVALVFGLVFVVAGAIALAGGSVVDQGAFLLPAGLIGLGLAVMLEARRRTRRDP